MRLIESDLPRVIDGQQVWLNPRVHCRMADMACYLGEMKALEPRVKLLPDLEEPTDDQVNYSLAAQARERELENRQEARAWRLHLCSRHARRWRCLCGG